MGSARDRRRRQAAVAVGCLVVAGTGIGVGVSQAEASGPTDFRTAAATTASVQRTLEVSGVLQPVSSATAAFQVAGTVTAVSVIPGQRVTAGQAIASLDPTLLQGQVTAAQAALTAAQAKLAADESAPSTTSTAAASAVSSTATVVLTSATSTSTGSGPAGAARAGTGAGGQGSLAADQQAVVAAQHAADLDIQAARAALATVGNSCGGNPPATPAPPTTGRRSPGSTTTTAPPSSPSTSSTTSTTSTTTGTAAGTTTTSTPTPTSGGASGSSSTTACTTALQQAGAAEQKVATDQQQLAAAEATLAKLLSSQATSGTARSAAPAGNASGAAGSAGSSRPSAVNRTGGGTAPVAGSPTAQPADTPAQLAGDQASIDSADASLAQAEQALAATHLTSPIAGTVASVGMAVGQTVAAGSATAAVTIIDPGAYQTTTSLTTSQVQEVKVGQRAQLTVDGRSATLDGTVSTIGPVDTGNSSYTYPVTIAITSPTGEMATGAATRIGIDVAGAKHVLAVPTSAVHTSGTGRSFVYLLRNGKETRQTVTVGVVGPLYTQIRSGVTAGQRVVLADPSQPVPASSTNPGAGGFGAGRFGPVAGFRLGGFLNRATAAGG